MDNKNYIVTAESIVDMPAEYMEEKQVPYIGFPYLLNGKEHTDDFWQTVPPEEFYNELREGASASTSQVNQKQFYDFFKPFLQEGKDVIHMTLSSGLTGSINNAINAANELMEEFPERKIRIIDTLGASGGVGLILDTVIEKQKEGADFDELADWIDDNKLNMHYWFYVGDLDHLKRGGRISGASAVIGNMLNIVPILNISNEGKLETRKKIRGRKAAAQHLVKLMEKHAQGGRDYSGKCYITQADCMDGAEEVAALVEKNFPKLNGKVKITHTGPVIGAHTGSGTVELFFWGDKRED